MTRLQFQLKSWLLTPCLFFWGLFSQVAMPNSALSQDPATATNRQKFAWQFRTADRFQVVLHEKSTVRTECNTLVNLNEVDLTLGLDWTVREAGPDLVTLAQTVSRIEMVLNTRTDDNTNQVRYDTGLTATEGHSDAGNSSQPVVKLKGAELEVQKQLQALVGLTVVLQVKPSGQIEKVEIDEDNAEKIRQAPSATVVRQMMTREGLEQIFRQGLLVLPDTELTPGESWQTEQQLVGALGGRNRQSKLTWQGPESVNNRLVQRFVMTSTLGPAPAVSADQAAGRLAGDPQLPPEVKSYQESGVFDFDPELGVFVDGRTDTQLVTSGKFRELEIVTEFSRNTQLKINRQLTGSQPPQ